MFLTVGLFDPVIEIVVTSSFAVGMGPSFSLKVFRRSGFAGTASFDIVSGPRAGAAFIRELPPVPAFLRLMAEGTNTVLSFLKSRSSGSANTVAAAATDALGGAAGGVGRGGRFGFLGNDELEGAPCACLCAWNV